MTRRTFMVGATVLWMTAGIGNLGADEAKKAARLVPALTGSAKVAREWLDFVDRGEYARSWEVVGTDFKAAMERERWLKGISTMRQPLGSVKDRKMAFGNYIHQGISVAPAGARSVVHQFFTSFEHKPWVIEVLTTTRDKDGQWRVIGYFMK
jgi:hypothetical protein